MSLAAFLHEFNKAGLLLLTDRELPRLTTLIAAVPVKGSWWGHEKDNLVNNQSYELMERLIHCSESLHTDSGKHVRQLMSWKKLMRDKTK